MFGIVIILIGLLNLVLFIFVKLQLRYSSKRIYERPILAWKMKFFGLKVEDLIRIFKISTPFVFIIACVLIVIGVYIFVIDYNPFSNKNFVPKEENLTGYNGCDVNLNNDVQNTTVPYINQEKGITFDVPYNKNWSADGVRIEPYVEDPFGDGRDAIAFGSPTTFEACSVLRSFYLYFEEQKSAEDVVSRINSPLETNTKDINGFVVVEYLEPGLCTNAVAIVIGEKYNYRFTPLCDNKFEPLEDVIKTMSIIE